VRAESLLTVLTMLTILFSLLKKEKRERDKQLEGGYRNREMAQTIVSIVRTGKYRELNGLQPDDVSEALRQHTVSRRLGSRMSGSPALRGRRLEESG
jgi:hypothetical protein